MSQSNKKSTDKKTEVSAMEIPKELEQVLKLIPEENRGKATGLIIGISRSMSYAGP